MQGIADMHCHLIPGVDDGAKSYEEALKILQGEYEEGVRHVMLTPHFRRRMFEPSDEIIKEHYLVLKQKAEEVLPEMQLYLGCELHASMGMIDRLRNRPQMCLGDSNYVLVEFSEGDDLRFIQERLRAVRSAGYRPVVAHAERYPALMKNLSTVEELVDMGIWIQVNADSILGEEGWGMKRLCKKLMKENLIHLVGSDAHNRKDRPSRIGECARYVEKKMGNDYAKRLFVTNPLRIMNA